MEYKIKDRIFSFDEPTFKELEEFKNEFGFDLMGGTTDNNKLTEAMKDFKAFPRIMSSLLKNKDGKKFADRKKIENWIYENAGITDFREFMDFFSKIYKPDSESANYKK